VQKSADKDLRREGVTQLCLPPSFREINSCSPAEKDVGLCGGADGAGGEERDDGLEGGDDVWRYCCRDQNENINEITTTKRSMAERKQLLKTSPSQTKDEQQA
jgi:hypothetical protein